MSYQEEGYEEYDPDLFAEYGEGFEDEFDAVSEKSYEDAFDKASGLEVEEEINEDDYEFDSIVGGRDKKPVMSLLNKGKLSKYEMDDLLNTLE
jgi:hypothetical protein